MRPSRRPLHGLLRMRNFLMLSKGLPHAEERPQDASRSTHDRDACSFSQALSPVADRESKNVKKDVGWLSIFGLIELIAAAAAQTPSPSPANTQFDGAYAFVSATKLNETYMTTWRTRIGRCGDIRRMGSLTIAERPGAVFRLWPCDKRRFRRNGRAAGRAIPAVSRRPLPKARSVSRSSRVAQ